MRKMVKRFALVGGLIPLLLLAMKFVELHINRETVPYASLYGFYLWPTSILLLGSHDPLSPKAILWLAVSVIANAILYAVIGIGFALGMATVKKFWPRRGRHGP